MHETHLVRLGERIGDLGGDAEGLVRRQRTLRQPLLQRLAFHQFHDQEVNAVLMADIVQRADVRVGKFRNCLGFAVQSLAQSGIGRQIGGQDFDGYIALESSVAGAIHLTHPAGAERGEDFVRSELGARRERPCRRAIIARTITL